MWPNSQFPADFVTFTKEILMENFIFCAVMAKYHCPNFALNSLMLFFFLWEWGLAIFAVAGFQKTRGASHHLNLLLTPRISSMPLPWFLGDWPWDWNGNGIINWIKFVLIYYSKLLNGASIRRRNLTTRIWVWDWVGEKLLAFSCYWAGGLRVQGCYKDVLGHYVGTRM